MALCVSIDHVRTLPGFKTLAGLGSILMNNAI